MNFVIWVFLLQHIPRWLTWSERTCLLHPTTVLVDWCTYTTVPSCNHGLSSHSAPPQTCRAWCCRWRARWSSCGPPLFWLELVQPFRECRHIHICTHYRHKLNNRQHGASKITNLPLTSVRQKTPHVVSTLLLILFDSAQFGSGGHVCTYAEWTAWCTNPRKLTEPENDQGPVLCAALKSSAEICWSRIF